MQRWIDVSGTPGHPIDKDIQTYPSVHLTGPHECDPSVLDYVHPEDNGEPDFLKGFQLTHHQLTMKVEAHILVGLTLILLSRQLTRVHNGE